MASTLAPVVLFAHRRPTHTNAVLNSLRANEEALETDLIAYVDGPRSPSEIQQVEEVSRILLGAKGFRSVEVRRSKTNLGLARSITGGVSEILANSDRIIVLEDDIRVSPYFLRYMNDHLDLYENDERVASIHAAVYPHTKQLPETFFIRGADCWGWGTWSRAWAVMSMDGPTLLAELEERQLTNDFDFDGTAPYTEMLRDQIARRNDSWAIRWKAAAFLRGMYTLYPNLPMAVNFGEDGTGTHGGVHGQRAVLGAGPVSARLIKVEECFEGREEFKAYFQARHPLYRTPSQRALRQIMRPLWRRLPRKVRRALASRNG